MVYFSEELAEV